MPEADRTPKVVIDHLSFSYEDGTEGLRDVSLNIYPNEITALFGPAGGGKSTLLRALNRLNDLVSGTRMSGRVLLDGKDLYAPGVNVTALRRRVGIVFAQPVPLPMSIRQNVEYGPRLAGVRNQAILNETVERSLIQAALWDEIQDRLDDPAVALSGGQQQRLCLARVLALEPELIMLDEPTSGLDPISTAKVEQSLQELKATYTILIAPHNIQQAARVADHAAFLLQGQLIEEGVGKLLFTTPRESKTEDYVTGRFG
ncbi:MAG: phosphate ABC transporter ATP-binding protein [Thermoflexales bacterium]|nr:phosphate ABC transporter ATP-binding protein [Thermoflexales bacterium]